MKLYKALQESFVKHANQVALEINQTKITYKELAQESQNLLAFLDSNPINEGQNKSFLLFG